MTAFLPPVSLAVGNFPGGKNVSELLEFRISKREIGEKQFERWLIAVKAIAFGLQAIHRNEELNRDVPG
jgi:hypothetical protein